MIRLPGGSALIGPSQQSMRTRSSENPRVHNVAIPWPPGKDTVYFVGLCGLPFLILSCISFLTRSQLCRTKRSESCRVKSPGDRPRAMGIFKGSGRAGPATASRAREALRLNAYPALARQPHGYRLESGQSVTPSVPRSEEHSLGWP